MSFAKQVWDTLSKVDCGKHIEKKGNLSYLSWAWAWAELMRHYPESSYSRLPDTRYPDDSVEVGFTVTVSDGEKLLSREMWLPVMDNKNNAIKNPDARKISDSRMRCLVKCLAMFGLGHYIYAGEDLPQQEEPDTDSIVDSIMSAESMPQLQAAFTEAWKAYDNKSIRERITKAKDIRKSELARNEHADFIGEMESND